MPRSPGQGSPRIHRELKPEFLVLGLLDRGSAHGYELLKAFRREFSGLWRVSESQFYGIIRRLEAQGLVSAAEAAGTRERRTLSLTTGGRKLLEDWLAEPSPASPRLLHMEFLTRLAFARARSPGAASELIESQLRILEAELRRLEEGSGAQEEPGSAEELSRDFRLRQLRAASAWIVERVRPTFA